MQENQKQTNKQKKTTKKETEFILLSSTTNLSIIYCMPFVINFVSKGKEYYSLFEKKPSK